MGQCSHPRTLKKYLISARGYKCEGDCAVEDTWNGNPITLQLDHIDGNSDNNFLSNLRLLCPNCHSQTPTYKGGNKSKKMTAREVKRRQRYQDEKL